MIPTKETWARILQATNLFSLSLSLSLSLFLSLYHSLFSFSHTSYLCKSSLICFYFILNFYSGGSEVDLRLELAGGRDPAKVPLPQLLPSPPSPARHNLHHQEQPNMVIHSTAHAALHHISPITYSVYINMSLSDNN